MSKELEAVRDHLYKAGVAERLSKNEDFQEYEKMLDAEISYFVNQLIAESTHPKDYVKIRAEINARKNVRNLMKRLIAQKGKLLQKQEELEKIEDA